MDHPSQQAASKVEPTLTHIASYEQGQVVESDANGGIIKAIDTKETIRGLRPRQVQVMAISGAIGTGLFLGSGGSLAKAGPAGVFLAYLLYAGLTWSTFNAMGEMVTALPIDGSFIIFAHAYVDEAFGFALGWLYTIYNALVVAAEISAACAFFGYWTDAVNDAVYITIITLSMLALNLFGVRIYGEGEFWFSSFKIFLIMGLIVMTFILMVGGNPSHDAFGFRYWKDPGAFNEYLVPGSTGRFLAFWGCFVQAAYAFGGPDYIALAAGETRAPRRVLPSVFSRVIYRLIFFYILGILAAGILVPSNDPDLTASKPGAGSSPFVLGVQRLGIPVLPSIINAVLLTSAWSCGIEVFYASTRSLYALSVDRKAPAFLLKTWRGVPIYCVLAIWLVAQISYMAASNSSLTVFNWLVNIIGSAQLLTFLIFHVIYLRFRNAQKAQGVQEEQRFWHRKRQYLYSVISLGFYSLILITNGFSVFIKGNWSTADFIFAYLSIGIFVVFYVGYKLVYRPKILPASQVPLMAGRTEADIDDTFIEKTPSSKGEKFSRWLWG